MDSRRCAALGAQFLDLAKPDWAHHINVHVLDQANPRHCVLGQLFGSFRLGLARLKLDAFGTKVLGLGFSFFDPHAFQADRHASFNKLTLSWLKEVSKRKNRRS